MSEMSEQTEPTTLVFDVDLITPRMMVDFQEHTGHELMAMLENDLDLATVEAKVVAGFIWLALRMGGQTDATFDDALDTPFAALNMGAAEPDPTPASSAA